MEKKPDNADAIKDAEGWLEDYKRTGNPDSLRMSIFWLDTALRRVKQTAA